MKRKIQIYDHVFHLNVSDDGKTVTTCSFNMYGRLPADLNEDELKEGGILKQEIFDGKWMWLINKEGPITLPVYNILIIVTDVIYDGSVRFGGGSSHSNLKEICPHCRDLLCDFDCEESQKWMNIKDSKSSIAKRAELEGNRKYNYACDGVEAMILGHAIAGVNITSPAYLEGIEAAVEGMANNI